MSAPKALVTGAAGFIAFHLIERLLRAGVAVTGIDNFDPFYDVALKKKNISDLKELAAQLSVPFHFQELDICELTTASFASEDFGFVAHLAAKAGVRPSILAPEAYAHVNVAGTLRVLEFCRERKIDRLVFGSSSSVYGDDTPVPFNESAPCAKPVSPYAATKRAGELLCSSYAHLHKIRIASLRFFTAYGPRQRPDLAIHKFCQLITRKQPLPFYGDGTTSRDYTHVSDIVTGIFSAIDWTANSAPSSFEIFNLGGSKAISLKELVERLESSLGKKADLERHEMQQGDVLRTFADLNKSKRVLGYAPSVSIQEGLKDFVSWFLKSY